MPWAASLFDACWMGAQRGQSIGQAILCVGKGRGEKELGGEAGAAEPVAGGLEIFGRIDVECGGGEIYEYALFGRQAVDEFAQSGVARDFERAGV